MKLSITICITLLLMNPQHIDFGTNNGLANWRVVNDGVMGGVSTGQVSYSDTSMTFAGNVSLKNNGGFASIRSSYQQRDLSEFTKVRIKYRSEGYIFAFSMNKDRRFWIPNYKQDMEQTNWEWKTSEFDLLDFKEYYIGRPTGKKVSETELGKIIQIGFITNEKREGAFKIEIDYLEFI